MQGRAWLMAIAVLALAGCGSSGGSSAGHRTGTSRTTSTDNSSPGAWNGFGAKLVDWEGTHPKQTAGCPAGTCFGNKLTISGATTYQFQLLTTTGPPESRVDGYEQAFNEETPVAAARAEVLKLMPSDTHTLSFSVQHTSSGSCAFWNLQSATLGKYLSAPKVGDARGVIGIDLSSETSSGESAYSPSDIRTATIWIAPLSSGTDC
jgi:hypothetical protein